MKLLFCKFLGIGENVQGAHRAADWLQGTILLHIFGKLIL